MQTYTIGEVSEMLGITIDTIRYYDKEGLLPFVKRDKSGRRVFTKDNVQLMQMILGLKNAGVPVKEIVHFVSWRLDGDTSLGERYAFLDKHEKNLEQKIADLEQSLAHLRFKKWYYKTAIEAGTEKIHSDEVTNHVRNTTYDRYQELLDSGQSAIDLGNF